ncbi:MAG: ATP-binding protein [Gammaproteobacteria bacterium]|jgi:AAA+ ATPase superfamily predicted ATPase
MPKFIGRKNEIKRLVDLLQLDIAVFIVLKGRRRIGKSRLLEEYSNNFAKIFVFSGLPPEKNTTNETQLKEFLKQLTRQLPSKNFTMGDWGDLFWQLSKYTKEGKVLIVLDEINWMGSKDPNFLGKLKNAWDLYFKKNDQLALAVSGSAASWIEKNLLNSTGFVGRVSLDMTLEEMPLKDCLEFWKNKHYVSVFNALKLLSITGGVPRYLELIRADLSAEINIKNLCFTKDGVLFSEFDEIFHDLFSKRRGLYKRIVTILADGALEPKEICQKLGIKAGGDISEYLNDLVCAGFITRDYTWNIKSGKLAKFSQFRLKDNYSRFYLKYILPRKPKIEKEDYIDISLADLPGWNAIMGLQFENLVLSNRNLIKKVLQINLSDVIYDNPFFQHKTTKQAGCQIDYLIQTRLNTLFVCEIKFSKKTIGLGVVDEVKEKINRLKVPKGFSCFPILIHANDVSDALEDSGYFTKIIDFTKLIESE